MFRARKHRSVTLSRSFGKFQAAQSGSVAIMFALCMPLVLACAALATDLGMMFLERRTLQTASDAAAMAAASKPETAQASIRTLLDAHGFKTATFVMTKGMYDETVADPTKRFTTGSGGNGVRVDTTYVASVYFARIFSMQSATLTTRSEAAMAPIVSMSAGSRLASVGASPVNGLVKSVLGVNLNLKAADYTGLLQTDIELGPLLNSIVNAGLVRNTTDVLAKDVLAVPIKLSVLLDLLSDQVKKNGDLVAGATLHKAALGAIGANVTVVLGDIIQVSDGIGNLNIAHPGPALRTEISALGLLNAAIAPEGIGNSIKTSLEVPGILSAGVEMLVGEKGKTANSLSLGELPSIRTDQVKARISIKALSLLSGLNVGVSLPIEIIAAGGTAQVVSVNCDSDPAKREVKVEVRPGILRLSVGEFEGALKDANVNDTLERTDLVKLLLASITGQANLAIKQTTPIMLTFKGTDIGSSIPKTAKTTTFAQSLVKTLLMETKLRVKLLGFLEINLEKELGLVSAALSTLTPVIDTLLNNILSLVGVSLGEMDVQIDGLSCGVPKLVG